MKVTCGLFAAETIKITELITHFKDLKWLLRSIFKEYSCEPGIHSNGRLLKFTSTYPLKEWRR